MLYPMLFIFLFASGCTTLGTREEYLALPEPQARARSYDYMTETRRICLGAAGGAVTGIILGGVALGAAMQTGQGLEQLSIAVTSQP